MTSSETHARDFLRAGHAGTLVGAFAYFGTCFAVWILNGALAPFLTEELALSPSETGMLVSMPVFAGALLRLPLGLLAEVIGRKHVAMLNMAIVATALGLGWLCVDSYLGLVLIGIPLGVAGASFGVGLALGAGWYPARFKGLAMGIVGAGNAGAVIAVLLAPPLARAFGWQTVYGFAALPVLLAMWILHRFVIEPPDRDRRPWREYASILVDRDAWILALLYMVTFGGTIGLTSFLPTFFHDAYAVPKESVGGYTAVAVFAASALRIVGGWLADRIGGVRLLLALGAVIVSTTLAAATLPASLGTMVCILVLCFAAMGAGNGAVFQLVPLRFGGATAVASSLVGEVGALAGALVPFAMLAAKQFTGSFAPGFLFLLALAATALVSLLVVTKRWIGTWLVAGGRANESVTAPPVPAE